MSSARLTARLLGAAQAGAGVGLLLRRQTVLRLVGAGDDDLSRLAARVLGARLVGQGLLVASTHRAWVLKVSALVDGLHVATMAAPALGRSGRERAARVSGACALLSAIASLRIAARMARAA